MMRPSIALASHRTDVIVVATQFRTTNVRVFGSAMRLQDTEGSDLDILVDALPQTTLFDLGGLQIALEQLLGVKVDVLTPLDLPIKFRNDVLAQAIPV
jgi:uncharacterized protein